MKNNLRILVINPGSTSTKVALFEDSDMVFQENINHDAEQLSKFEGISEQLEYRKETIYEALRSKGISLGRLDACVGRGGGLLSIAGGTYEVDDLLLEHARVGANGTSHPAQLGVQLAKLYAKESGCRTFTVNPPDVDEFERLARVTGLKGVRRQSHMHALNLKETAIRHAESMGRKYEGCNFIVCHIGGGISVSAHKKGKMVDGNDIIRGEGPMTPTRCGSMEVMDMIELCYSGRPESEIRNLCQKNGGFVSYFGTSDAKEVFRMGQEGNEEAKLVFDTMIYQIAKNIGQMAAVLKGEVDGILLGGGMVYNDYLVRKIKDYCGFIAEVTAYPGEFEMEALANGAIRVLTGQEEAKDYGEALKEAESRR